MSTTTLNPTSREPRQTMPRPTATTNRSPRRGDIWFVDARSNDPALGAHRSVGCEIWSNKPAIVVSNDSMNARAKFVQIVYLTTAPTRRPNNLHPTVTIPEPDGHGGPVDALAFCEQIHSVDVSRLRTFQGQVDPAQLNAVDDLVFWALGLDGEGGDDIPTP